MTPLGSDIFRSAGAPSALQLRSRRSLRHNSHLSAKRAIYKPNRFYLANGPPFIFIIVLCDFPLNLLYVQVCTKKWDGHVLVIRVPLNSAGRRQGLISVVLCDFPLNLLYHDQTAKRPNRRFCYLAKRFSLTNQPEDPTWFSAVIRSRCFLS